MLLQKSFQNLQIAMVISVLFEHFSVKVCLSFSRSSDVRHQKGCILFKHLDVCVAYLRRKRYCYRSGSKLQKKNSRPLTKNTAENGWWVFILHTPSRSTPDRGHHY